MNILLPSSRLKSKQSKQRAGTKDQNSEVLTSLHRYYLPIKEGYLLEPKMAGNIADIKSGTCSFKIVNHYAVTMNKCVDIYIYTFLTLAIYGSEHKDSRPGCFIAEKCTL
jgi:hypothetical protein